MLQGIIKSTVNDISKYINGVAKNIEKNSNKTSVKEKNEGKSVTSYKNLEVKKPKDTKTEKVLNKANKALTVVTTVSEEAATLLAPLSIAGGLYTLGRIQNTKGRKAAFQAMATDGIADYLSVNNGKRLPDIKGYPTWQESAKGEGCYGQHAPLNSSFHNSSEKQNFINQHNKTMGFIKKMYRTPEGRSELKRFIKNYQQFKKSHPNTPSYKFFLKD